MQLTEILKQPDGFTPPDVTVTIDKVFQYKSGHNDNGEWSFQDIQVKGGGRLKLKGLPEFPQKRVGQTVTIRANQSKQHGLTGMKVAHEEYNGNTYDKLIITGSARWEWGQAAGDGNGGASEAKTLTYHSSEGVNESEEYRSHLLACAEMAGRVVNKLEISDPAAIQACFATICIDAKNRNILLPSSSTNGTDGHSGPGPEETDPFEEEDPAPF